MPVSIFSEKSQRILDFLRNELDLPKEVVGFELHIRLDDAMMVRNLDYYVEDDDPKEQGE